MASVAYGRESAWTLNGRDSEDSALPGLVHFNMDTKEFTNISTRAFPAPVQRGTMHYVPVYGPSGIYIALGGSPILNDPADLIDFGTLPVFDPSSRKWYDQTTTGNKPAARVDHCVAGAASSNQTYEIFVYSGFTGKLGSASVALDTISILTLPAFHWVSVPYNPHNPRHGHACRSVGGSQILVVGGADSNPKVTFGDYNEIERSTMEEKDPWEQGLGIFDLSTLTWSDRYSASPPPYAQSDPIRQYYSQTGR